MLTSAPFGSTACVTVGEFWALVVSAVISPLSVATVPVPCGVSPLLALTSVLWPARSHQEDLQEDLQEDFKDSLMLDKHALA